ncbi:hypothetical protein CcaCcLH18_02904 [Colletotrichum camelliae]|nr:hypothetical protein CcaCcLH18_02904 [Colletotrichum camelliae]
MAGSPYITAAEQYKTGTRLTLWQYEPVQPHGQIQYPRNPLPDDLPPDRLRDFDLEMTRSTCKEDVDKQAVLQVSKVISGGDNNTVQVILFDVIQRPVSYRGDAATLPEDDTQVVGLLYDTEFYPSDECAINSHAEQADGNLSRTDAALSHFFSKNKTGHPHVIPQYYGCWATRVDAYYKTAFRYVGLVLEEYINGHSIEDICVRDEFNELIPPDGAVTFHMPEDIDEGYHNLKISQELCEEIMKQALNGLVEHMHIGVRHNVFKPRKVFITLRNGKVGLNWPRAVILGFTNTQVWSKTNMAKGHKGPVHFLEHLPYPPHPFQRFAVKALQNFIGWWPSSEVGWYADKPDDFDNEAEFDEWLVSDKAFGPLVEAADVEAELGEGAEWPHPYNKYSLSRPLVPSYLEYLESKRNKRRDAKS